MLLRWIVPKYPIRPALAWCRLDLSPGGDQQQCDIFYCVGYVPDVEKKILVLFSFYVELSFDGNVSTSSRIFISLVGVSTRLPILLPGHTATSVLSGKGNRCNPTRFGLMGPMSILSTFLYVDTGPIPKFL